MSLPLSPPVSRLQAEWQRLYLPPGAAWASAPGAPAPDVLPLLVSQGLTRTGVLGLGQPADWDAVLTVWQAVQAEWGLPAPAIAVNGVDGYQLWFSVQAPVPLAVMDGFLSALQAAHWPGVSAQRVARWPLHTLVSARLPALQGDERWSAFLAPDLARLFADTPWLDFPPSDASQADVLSVLQSAAPSAFDEACRRLAARGPASAAPAPDGAADAQGRAGGPQPTGALPSASTPLAASSPARAAAEAFLLQVMHDPRVDMAWRLEAAKTLWSTRP